MPTLCSRRAALLPVLLYTSFGLSAADAPEPPIFAAEPSVAKAGQGFTIRFELARPADATVSILDTKGAVVRHLASGLLGPKAPAPYAPGALAQSVTWDGKDDLGQPAQGGTFKARVTAGVRPRFEKILGWNPRSFSPICGMAVAPGGELCVLFSDAFHGRSEMRVYDRKGAYLRTILPYPANTPKERTASIGHIEANGERLPVVFNGHNHTLHPLTAGMKRQAIGVHPKGYLLLASAVGTMAEHGPPRHLLALDLRGGAPDGVSFVGPRFLAPRGFMGGAAEGASRWFEHLVASPDGEWVYFVYGKNQMPDEDPRRVVPLRHAVFRLRWSDPELGAPFLGKDKEAGSDDAHFNDPQGLAVAKDGTLYVCDRGNNRVQIFAPDGKLTSKLAVPNPEQIALHPKTGELYVVSRKAGKDVQDATLTKFAPAGKDGAKELYKTELKGVDLIALDGEASPPLIWTSIGRTKSIVPMTDKDGHFETGTPINDNESGMEHPMFIAADPARKRLWVRERGASLYQLGIEDGKYAAFKLKATDVALDRAGNLYVMDGYNTNSISRYTPEGKPLPFSGTGTHKIAVVYRGYGPNLGLRGLCVGLNGDIYVIASTNYGGPDVIGSRVRVFGADGKLKHEALVNGLGYGDCGVGVDAANNVYVGVNVKPADYVYPEPFAGKVPEQGWIWWRGKEREAPWRYNYYNPYLFHIGSVFKFPPSGGTIYGQDIAERSEEGKRTQPLISAKNAPAGAAAYRSAYLGREVKVDGACWSYLGCSNTPSSSDGPAPDPGCVCFLSHLTADPYGRVFAPHTFRFCVEMLDTGGNLLARIGRYGNADSAGPGSKVPEPEIALACPGFIAVAEDKVYISDSVNRRVVAVRLDYAGEKVCPLE